MTGEPEAGAGCLTVVATPIGNLQDITLRALDVLSHADLIVTEDTRRTRALLSAHNIAGRLSSLPAYAEAGRIARILDRLAAGERLALCTDAGMPGISDPGAKLVRAAREAGFPVTVAPGPSALTTALVLSGCDGSSFHFLGFLPRSPGKMRKVLGAAAQMGDAIVFYESPLRLGRTLALVAEVVMGRNTIVAREMTKLHETIHEGSALQLSEQFRKVAPRGECTVIIEAGPAPGEADPRITHADRKVAQRGKGNA